MGHSFPVRLRAPGVMSTELADFYMSTFICSYARSILETALDGGYDFLQGLIFSTCCSHITRCGQHFDMLDINADNDKFFSYFLDTPRKIYDAGIKMMVKDMKKCASMIAEKHDVDTSEVSLQAAIKTHNHFNSIFREISDLRKADVPKITGTEFHTLFIASKAAPKDLLIEPLQKLREALDKRHDIGDYKARIMVVGSILDNPQFTELIESQGGLVVADRYCFGSLPGLEDIPESGDPFENLAKHYLESCECPRMMERDEDRLTSLDRWAEEYRIDGILFETMKFCDMWGYEGLSMVSEERRQQRPIVKMEREYAFSGEGQLRTRIQAFLELIETRQISSALKCEQAS